MMHVHACRQTRAASRARRAADGRIALAAAADAGRPARWPMPVARERVDVVGLGLVEKLGDIGGRDGVVARGSTSRRSSPKVASISNPGMNATSNQDTRLK